MSEVPARRSRRRTRPVERVPRLLLTRQEASASLGMSVDTFERGVQPFIKVVPCGQLVLVPGLELERWVAYSRALPGRTGRLNRPVIVAGCPASGAPALVADAVMTEWQTSNRKGLYVRHAKRCGARRDRRCSFEPSYRGKRRNPGTGQPEYSSTSKQRSEILSWLRALARLHVAARALRAVPARRRLRRPRRLAHRGGRRAGVHRPLRAPRAQALDDQQSHGGGQRHLQPGRLPDPPPGRPQPGARGRAAPGDEVKRLRIADPAEAEHLLAALAPATPCPTRSPCTAARAAPSSERTRVARPRPRGAPDPRPCFQERGGDQPPRPVRRAAAARSCAPHSCARTDPPAGACSVRRA